jgi:hypothetical protein
MKSLRKIAFVVEEFALGTPAQQLLDRFLMGYPHEGGFRRLDGCAVAVHLVSGAKPKEIEQRENDFGLAYAPELAGALADADGVVVVWRGAGARANESLLTRVVEQAPAGCACFVHGALAASDAGAREIARAASARRIALAAGATTAVTWRLPEVDVPRGARLRQALIVVQGQFPDAEFEALEGLLPLLERRRGGETGVARVRHFDGSAVWEAGERGLWSWPLLAAALSRSDNPQGDAAVDGRTQDLVGLGLVPRLARQPRGWVLDHRDGLRSAILVLDGVVGDYNFALDTVGHGIISAQLYRPRPPAQQQFSRLAAVVEDYFRTGQPPWPIQRSFFVSGWLAELHQASARSLARS